MPNVRALIVPCARAAIQQRLTRQARNACFDGARGGTRAYPPFKLHARQDAAIGLSYMPDKMRQSV
jgi:hypothetical protein